MYAFIIRRIMTIPITLLLVTFVTFIVLRVTGDPVQIYLDINATAEQTEILRQRLNLDRPLIVQFGLFVADILRGDFGDSLQFATPALPAVIGRLGATLTLVSTAFVVAVILGVAAGILAEPRKDRMPDFL